PAKGSTARSSPRTLAVVAGISGLHGYAHEVWRHLRMLGPDAMTRRCARHQLEGSGSLLALVLPQQDDALVQQDAGSWELAFFEVLGIDRARRSEAIVEPEQSVPDGAMPFGADVERFARGRELADPLDRRRP